MEETRQGPGSVDYGTFLNHFQVRKLEFLLADAVHKGCRHVITVGGVQSNHCRATAVAARQLGLTPHLILRSENEVSQLVAYLQN